MDKVLIFGGTVITLGEKNRIISDGAVLIEEGVIQRIGKTQAVKKHARGAKRINARGGVIMPGFINAHMHLYSTFARGLCPKQPPAENFNEVLERLWFPLDKALNEEDIKYSAMIPYVECIKNGTTTIIDHHESQGCQSGVMDVLERASRRMGVRSALCLGVSDRYGNGLAGVEENVRFIKRIQAKQQRGDDLVSALFGMHALFTVNQQTLEQVAEAARDLGAGMHVHVAEAASDQAFNKENYGMTVVKRLERAGLLGERCIAVHGVHVSRADMNVLAKTGTRVVHNPQSNMNNAVGIADVMGMQERGVCVGLGTDGMSSNMREEVRFAVVAQRLRSGDPSAFFVEGCNLLLQNNARIVRPFFARQVGELCKGAYGDVIVLDYDPPTPLSTDTFLGHFLFGLCGAPVRTTVVNGRVLMEDGQLKGINEANLMRESRKQAKAFWKRF
jgi:putative selenium metabolism protein SsnA